MSLLLESEIRARAKIHLDSKGFGARAETILNQSVATAAASPPDTFDIFLSHSIKDADVVLGVRELLNSYGHSVYVDWINDGQLDRRNVDKETATVIRSRIQNCKSLLYLTSVNSTTSRWMPWECGYKDGENSRVAILPFAQSYRSSFHGTEYLSLYPYITEEESKSGDRYLYTNENQATYCLFDKWLDGENPFFHG